MMSENNRFYSRFSKLNVASAFKIFIIYLVMNSVGSFLTSYFLSEIFVKDWSPHPLIILKLLGTPISIFFGLLAGGISIYLLVKRYSKSLIKGRGLKRIGWALGSKKHLILATIVGVIIAIIVSYFNKFSISNLIEILNL